MKQIRRNERLLGISEVEGIFFGNRYRNFSDDERNLKLINCNLYVIETKMAKKRI